MRLGPHKWGDHITSTASRPVFQARPSRLSGPSLDRFAIALRAHRLSRCIPAQCRGTWCACAPPLERLLPLYPRGPRSGPGYSVPVHLHLSDPMRPTRRHIPTSPLCGLYGMPSLCACTTTPRQPTTGSVLSWMIFRNMSPSRTPGNSSAACAQYFTENAGLQLQGTVSAFPIILTLRFW